jgi:hypothetical protein
MSQQSVEQAPSDDKPTVSAVDVTVKDYKVNFLGPKSRTKTMDTIDLLKDKQIVAQNSASLGSKVKSLGGLFRRKSRSRA